MINHLHKYYVDLSILKLQASWMLGFFTMTEDDDDDHVLLSARAGNIEKQDCVFSIYEVRKPG